MLNIAVVQWGRPPLLLNWQMMWLPWVGCKRYSWQAYGSWGTCMAQTVQSMPHGGWHTWVAYSTACCQHEGSALGGAVSFACICWGATTLAGWGAIILKMVNVLVQDIHGYIAC